MSENIKDQIPLNNVKKFINYYLEHLQKEGFTLFQGKPTVEVFPKRKNLVGLSLINEKNTDIKCYFINNPHQGDDYLFVSVEELKHETMLQELGESYALGKLNQLRVDNAYSINLQRVENLLKDGHYAVALVFLVSAFENITRDLFFLHNESWFVLDDEFDDEIYEKLGIIIDPKMSKSFILGYYSRFKEINGIKIGIDRTKLDLAEKWKNVRYWEKIHNICKSLGVYNEYIHKKQGNNGMEIGRFEILKEILKKQANVMKILNFQKVSGKWGIKKLFQTFFNIDLNGFKKTLTFLDVNIKKRHEIIHGTLQDNQIDEYMVRDFKSRIFKIISYLRDELDRKYIENVRWGIQ
ncbi:hypothetical protein ES705_27761 [subsurface metagenome]